MTIFAKMKNLSKRNTVEDLAAALADLDQQEAADRSALEQLKSDLGRAVVAGDEAAATRIQGEKGAIASRLELAPIARAEIERRRAEAEAAKAEAELLATMAAAEKANGRRRDALKRLHKLFSEAADLLEVERAADREVREANSKARAAGRADLQIEAVEAAAARRRERAYAELGTTLSPAPVDFRLNLIQLPGYAPAAEASPGREFLVRPLSLIE